MFLKINNSTVENKNTSKSIVLPTVFSSFIVKDLEQIKSLFKKSDRNPAVVKSGHFYSDYY